MTEIATFPTTIEPRGFITAIVNAVMAAHARRADRRAYEDLLSHDDETFRDVGLSRSDVRRALNARRS